MAEQAVRRTVIRLDVQDLRSELKGREPDSAARHVFRGRKTTMLAVTII